MTEALAGDEIRRVIGLLGADQVVSSASRGAFGRLERFTAKDFADEIPLTVWMASDPAPQGEQS